MREYFEGIVKANDKAIEKVPLQHIKALKSYGKTGNRQSYPKKRNRENLTAILSSNRNNN